MPVLAAAEEHEGGESAVTICAECDRFLYNMMRMISGTLVQVGLGRLSPAQMGDLLAARGRSKEGGVNKAPAHGLCLERCFVDVDDGPWVDEPAAEIK